jgi:acyl carrier protein
MESQNILSRLQPIFRDVFDERSLSVGRESSAETVEGWDSLAHINLITSIEQEFGIKFALGELQNLKNVGEMVDLMEVKLDRRK